MCYFRIELAAWPGEKVKQNLHKEFKRPQECRNCVDTAAGPSYSSGEVLSVVRHCLPFGGLGLYAVSAKAAGFR